MLFSDILAFLFALLGVVLFLPKIIMGDERNDAGKNPFLCIVPNSVFGKRQIVRFNNTIRTSAQSRVKAISKAYISFSLNFNLIHIFALVKEVTGRRKKRSQRVPMWFLRQSFNCQNSSQLRHWRKKRKKSSKSGDQRRCKD